MIENINLANQILEIMDTSLECTDILLQYLESGDLSLFFSISDDLYHLLDSIRDISTELKKEESALNLPEASISVLASLSRIMKLTTKDTNEAKKKIEFELIPLIEDMRMRFYFWGMCYPDKEKINHYYKNDICRLNQNKYISQSEKNNNYKYEVSFLVWAYNKLDCTKVCIENLLKNIPAHLKYELVLLNHGSNDGTKEYFESLCPDKQMDIEVNGGGAGAVHRILEGKYQIAISNDVIVTPNAIQNLINCIESDERIAWVVPSTSNVSNLQTIFLGYANLDELYQKAEENNISDPFRWEQRVRLCNPIDIKRNSVYWDLHLSGYLYSKLEHAFPDDKMSAFFRRNGYKMYLAKDAYCHHIGAGTIKEGIKNSQDFYMNGRQDFCNTFGIDPWGAGFCYDSGLFQILPCDKVGHVDILGINCGLGSNPLKIKESLKEKVRNTDVSLYSCCDQENYLDDLRGISDRVDMLDSLDSITTNMERHAFDYIIIEDAPKNETSILHIWNTLLSIVQPGGYLVMKIEDKDKVKKIKSRYQALKVTPPNKDGCWVVYQK